MRLNIVVDASSEQAHNRAVANQIAPLLSAKITLLSAPLAPNLRLLSQAADVILNLLASFQGRPALVPHATLALEGLQLRLTGSPSAARRLCLHREDTQRALRVAGARAPSPRTALPNGQRLLLSLLETPQDLELLPPMSLDPHAVPFPKLWPNQLARLARMSRHLFTSLGLSGYAQLTVLLDACWRLWVLDLDLNPSLAPRAPLALAAQQAGLSYEALLRAIVASAKIPERAQTDLGIHSYSR